MQARCSTNTPAALALILTLAIFAPVVSADDGRFYIAPGVQWMNFGSELPLHNEQDFTLGLGYGLTDRVDMEFDLSRMEPELSGAAGDVDYDHWRLDFLYDLQHKLGQFDTFVVGGLGENDFDFHDETVLNLGAGIKYALSDSIDWRTSARTFLSLDSERVDTGIETSLVFRFGGRRQAAPGPAPAPAVTTVQAPVSTAIGDADGDGVPDDRDACPDTPRNYAVDSRGCPIATEEVARFELKVNFDFDRAEVKPEYLDEIQGLAEFMRQYPDVIAQLEGHTDSVGTDEYNQGLSQRRVNAVRQVLIDRFSIQGSRLTATGYGESRPVASNETSAGRAENRRVITVIMKTLQRYQPR